MSAQSPGNQRPWWVRDKPSAAPPVPRLRAVAYYRHSAQDRQENSVAIQQEQVNEWARANGVDVVQEFADRGKSGLTAKGRDGFNDMMENWVKKRDDFDFVLCLDVSRWGRFQDIDLSATYSAECKSHGKEVIYTKIGRPKEDDSFYPVYIQFERFRSAQYVKELSEKVHHGCVKVAQQGYWAGGTAPYGLQRLLLDETHKPVQVLGAGQRKSIQNQRVTLALGKEDQMAVVRRVFQELTETGRIERDIAEGLNRDGIPSACGGLWNREKVRKILKNELYIGTLVYNRTTQKLKTPTRQNPTDQWVRTIGAFPATVPPEVFEKAQRIMRQRGLQYTPELMVEQLGRLFHQHGCLRPALVRADHLAPSPSTYAKHFASLDAAYQRVFQITLAQVKEEVESLVRGLVQQVESHEDFLVVNRKFTVLIQPSVPMPHGYSQYWYFRPDGRGVVDITLGVPVSGPKGPQILGYLALPRLLIQGHGIRLFGSSQSHLDMYGYHGLDIIFQLARS